MPAFGDSKAFMRGYGRPELSPSERVRRRLYNLYLTLIMTIETRYRGHDGYAYAREQLDAVMALLGRAR